MISINLPEVDEYYNYMFDTLSVLDNQQKYIFLTKLYIVVNNKYRILKNDKIKSEIISDFLLCIQILRKSYKDYFIKQGQNNVNIIF